MSSYREDCLKAKAVKEGIIELRPVSGKNGKAKPVILEYRTLPSHPMSQSIWAGNGKEWTKWKAYRTVEKAQTAAENLRRKHSTFYEFRLKD